ncbi:type I-C CRISPR-associated protein Cas7/Csd2 [Sporanaerobium hydrogeniformans]|uniref:Type I-C CRISPR-associated protein Cas7/Csd2 n=1 Tax=Sporanaerobium hydrogeniformans TaxID=3072179 RepID=A0AC61DFC9_9FIRM|nr:type I-C CRISPR-associated protein Cas7/Csd2 [Sporanaerobium hydrogeniformans]PHV71528.1 type I-C CRISPR-associated protein Cas7/Csd2 [Sporanaerobium hydrogeniformans]
MAIERRYEFVMLFDVENGNPNGDPDAGNMPRIDPETGLGIVTDVCIKRKIRNYVEVTREGEEGFNIYVKEGVLLNDQHRLAYEAYELEPKDKELPKDEKQAKELTGFMCKNFFDIRAFGAVMTTKVNCGQVRGPIQINFARSIDPIIPQELTITRVATTNEKEKAKGGHEMGRKQIVPYGLYRVEGYISAHLAQKVTGFDEEDLEVLWEALMNLFEHDHSAARGKMATRKLYIFEHDSALGNAPSHLLFEAIKVQKKEEKPARHFNDYSVTVDLEKVPTGVRLIEKL